MKNATLTDFLTLKQIEQCIDLWRKHGTGRALHQALIAEVVEPGLTDIDHKLGQPNDARYIAYAIEHVLAQAARAGSAS